MNLDKINGLVAEMMGHEPRIMWMATADGGKSYFFQSEYKREVEEYLKRTKKEYPNGWQAKGELMPWKTYRPYSSDLAAAWEVAEKARESFTSSEWKQFCTELCNDWRVLCGGAPKYIVQAALKAKGIEVGE